MLAGSCEKLRTCHGRALLISNMRLVFGTKIAHGRQHRIGSGLAQPAKRTFADTIAQILEKFQIPGLSPSLAYIFQDIEHLFGPEPAGQAFTA